MVMRTANEETSLSVGFGQGRPIAVIRFTLAFDISYRPSTLFCWFLATTKLKRQTLETHRTQVQTNETKNVNILFEKEKTRREKQITF